MRKNLAINRAFASNGGMHCIWNLIILQEFHLFNFTSYPAVEFQFSPGQEPKQYIVIYWKRQLDKMNYMM